MTKAESIKKVWSLVSTRKADDIKTAEKLAYEYGIFMAFDPDYIAVEDDVFYLNQR